jgi:anionic cell wall polymer biosynthesis LytR-Cps2A-Psr (LCP) family protein
MKSFAIYITEQTSIGVVLLTLVFVLFLVLIKYILNVSTIIATEINKGATKSKVVENNLKKVTSNLFLKKKHNIVKHKQKESKNEIKKNHDRNRVIRSS